jgi:Family of unknown function (DUF5317)
MLLILIALLCVLSVPLAGGDLRRLAHLKFRYPGLAAAALALQVAIVNVAPGGDHAVHVALHLLSYALAAWFAAANIRTPGVALIAAGGVLNLIAILANGGVMPTDPGALKRSGLTMGDGFTNSAALAHPHLSALGDIIAVPAGPLANVLSIGDLVLFAGLLVLVHSSVRRAGPGRSRHVPA